MGEQTLACLRDCYQRGGVSAIDRVARPLQVERGRNPGGEKIGAIARHHAVVPALIGRRILTNEIAGCANLLKKVSTGAASREDRGRLGVGQRIVARIFEGLPAAFEKHTVLRIGYLRFFRSHAEESSIELIHIRK